MLASHDRRPWFTRASTALSLVLFLTTAQTFAAEPVGSWKLVVLAFGPEEFAIIDLIRDGDATRGVLVNGRPRMFDSARVEDVVLEEDRARFSLKGGVTELSFSGVTSTTKPYEGQVLGTIQIQGFVLPAKLERTTQEKLAPPKPNPVALDFSKVSNDPDLKTRVKRLREFAAKYAGEPSSHLAYSSILNVAEAAGLSKAEVESQIATLRAEAKIFGDAWVQEATRNSFESIAPQKTYAEIAWKLGRELEANLAADAPLDARAGLVRRLLQIADRSGKTEEASELRTRLAQFEDQLDKEYRALVPPFQPTRYEGRKKADADQTVVMELFTGAQCPPCVAVDVAFDALLESYESDQFIGLQYHLHIPGPDPLTSPDALARADYYADQVSGTPSVFINGKADHSGGGPMAAAQDKYNQFRQLIDDLLERPKRAEVVVSADRQGDEISIRSHATIPAANPNSGKPAVSRVKLRLALTEKSIRYVGMNRLRFHHHVVRAFPGGPGGAPIMDGKGEIELKLNLADLRKGLQAYVDEFAQARPFAGALPEIDLKDLHVVAFVQDDRDRAILAATSLPIAESTP